MKRTRELCVVGFVASFSASLAHAQTVTVYGLLDQAVEHVSNVAGGNGINRIPTLTGSLPSRLGFRGAEDLGGGLRAIFTLEQGFGPDTGTLGQGGRAFGRQAFVGLSGNWGTVTLGRQYTMLFWSLLEADIFGPNLYGISSLDSYIPNARADNAIAYRGTFSGFTVGATYSMGRDAVNAGPSPVGTNCSGEGSADKGACREWSALAKYDSTNWGLALGADILKGGPGAFAGLTSSSLQDQRISANGYVKFGSAKIGLGLIRRNNEGSALTSRSDLWYLGAAYAVTPLVSLEGMMSTLKFKNSANKAALIGFRATYSLSKRTAVYATAGHIANDGALALSVSSGQPGSNPAVGGSQSALAAGVRHSF
jgi:predicted porin